jgi:succinate dehydrogenase / fumarate reductase flavoprotein subunit
MQGLADGYFVLPTTINDYLGGNSLDAIGPAHPAVTAAETEARDRLDRLLSVNGTRTVDDFHRELGLLMWDHCGMSRNESGLREALARVPELRAEFWRSVRIPGTATELNQELEKANRVADLLELAELMLLDALVREESCGGHFREDHQTADGEALRDDTRFSHVAAWEYGEEPVLYKEELTFDQVHPTQRSYT